MNKKPIITATLLATLLAGCATTYTPAMSPVSIDPTMSGPVAGVGIEGHHVIDMTQQMIADLRSTPMFTNQAVPPRIIIDGTEFKNRGAQRIDKDIIANRLRIFLNRAAQGDLVFVGRHYQQSIDNERRLKQAGLVDGGTIGQSAKTAGADYKLGGTIQTITSRSSRTGMLQQYNLITFELFDLDYGTVVWSNAYEFSAASADDVVYR